MAHCVASDEKFSLAIILMLPPLVGQLLDDRSSHVRRHAPHALEIGQISQKSRRNGRDVSGPEGSFRSRNSPWMSSSPGDVVATISASSEATDSGDDPVRG